MFDKIKFLYENWDLAILFFEVLVMFVSFSVFIGCSIVKHEENKKISYGFCKDYCRYILFQITAVYLSQFIMEKINKIHLFSNLV